MGGLGDHINIRRMHSGFLQNRQRGTTRISHTPVLASAACISGFTSLRPTARAAATQPATLPPATQPSTSPSAAPVGRGGLISWACGGCPKVAFCSLKSSIGAAVRRSDEAPATTRQCFGFKVAHCVNFARFGSLRDVDIQVPEASTVPEDISFKEQRLTAQRSFVFIVISCFLYLESQVDGNIQLLYPKVVHY